MFCFDIQLNSGHHHYLFRNDKNIPLGLIIPETSIETSPPVPQDSPMNQGRNCEPITLGKSNTEKSNILGIGLDPLQSNYSFSGPWLQRLVFCLFRFIASVFQIALVNPAFNSNCPELFTRIRFSGNYSAFGFKQTANSFSQFLKPRQFNTFF